MIAPKFTRTIEDFSCSNCGFSVSGNGYTNHCPKCLWSKHVDENPGDRAAQCGGMMKPSSSFQKDGKWFVTQVCQVCGHTRNNTVNDEDNFDALVNIVNEV